MSPESNSQSREPPAPPPAMACRTMEAECKYRVVAPEQTRQLLTAVGAQRIGIENHRDTYLRHPGRDFRKTGEALRIREVDGQPMITYKGPRLDGPIKIRPEIELPLVAETIESWLHIWSCLGFEVVLTVIKQRETFLVNHDGRELTVALDQVDGLGWYAEIERLIHHQADIHQAELDILSFATQIGLINIERKSYLGLLMASSVSPGDRR